jgi:hypothetical protein
MKRVHRIVCDKSCQREFSQGALDYISRQSSPCLYICHEGCAFVLQKAIDKAGSLTQRGFVWQRRRGDRRQEESTLSARDESYLNAIWVSPCGDPRELS